VSWRVSRHLRVIVRYSHGCSRLDAFGPAARDRPQDKTAPFIERIRSYTRDEQADKKLKHEPETERRSEGAKP
jgi:hypothetical protein